MTIRSHHILSRTGLFSDQKKLSYLGKSCFLLVTSILFYREKIFTREGDKKLFQLLMADLRDRSSSVF
ncbi:hypothetical protein [Endozoicomonas sp. ALC020]|uniref:hypothetical protein n=1 Tax=unclassified Endozoicomonas TaxID=2644528 RepID=UPI003BB0F52F